MGSLLEARGMSAGYGVTTVVRDFDITVEAGEIVALLGPNGAGKSTTLLALAGELDRSAGEVFWERENTSAPLHRRANQGLAYVPEERSVYPRLTVRQNLAIARGGDPAKAVELFPELGSILNRRGGLLSGGEQQMLTLARALSRSPKLLLADELSLGLAPKTVARLLEAIRSAADNGLGALLVEQHVHRVLQVADRVVVLRNGRIEFSGTATQAKEQMTDIEQSYLMARPRKAAEKKSESSGKNQTKERRRS